MMIADTRAVLERAIEEGLFRYLLNRVNKHHTRIKWVTGLVFDREPLGEPQELKFDEYEHHIRRIVSEAVDCIFESVDEIIHFPEVTQGVTICACSNIKPAEPEECNGAAECRCFHCNAVREKVVREIVSALRAEAQVYRKPQYHKDGGSIGAYWHEDIANGLEKGRFLPATKPAERGEE